MQLNQAASLGGRWVKTVKQQKCDNYRQISFITSVSNDCQLLTRANQSIDGGMDESSQCLLFPGCVTPESWGSGAWRSRRGQTLWSSCVKSFDNRERSFEMMRRVLVLQGNLKIKVYLLFMRWETEISRKLDPFNQSSNQPFLRKYFRL